MLRTLVILRAVAIVAITVVAFTPVCARGADPEPVTSVELARPIGDVYNERTTDGDAYPQSLGLRMLLQRRDLALYLDYRRNVYLTESRGPGTLTQYARIEGGVGTSVPFLARESSFEARVEQRVGSGSLFAGVGVLRTWTNYHYPVLTGIGAGLELRADARAGIRPFGSAYYYPSASGRYTAEVPPNAMLTPSFGIVKLDAGVVVRSAHTRVYGVLGYGNEQRSGHALPRDVRLIRSDPYVAVGVRV